MYMYANLLTKANRRTHVTEAQAKSQLIHLHHSIFSQIFVWLHLRPILSSGTLSDIEIFRDVALYPGGDTRLIVVCKEISTSTLSAIPG